MATFKKRGRRWQARVRYNGVSKAKSFDSKREAKNWAENIESGASTNMLYAALDKYQKFEAPNHKSYRAEVSRLNKIRKDFPDMPLSELSSRHLAEWRDKRLKVVSGSAVRRDMSLFITVLNLAIKEWQWIDKNPFDGVRRPSNPPARKRGVTEGEIAKILKVQRWAETVESKRDQVTAAFLIALETAMRLSEILRCVIDKERAVGTLVNTKNGDKREVPLSSRALELFGLVGKFTMSPESLSVCFGVAKTKAGIHDLHFHDTRSEALTRLSKKLDVLQLAKMVGHRDPKSLMWYYSETAEDMAKLLD